jgi:chemotaxis protein MotA
LDRSTVLGITLGVLLIGGAVFVGPSAATFWNLPSVLIVGGGVIATTFIRFPAPVVLGSARVIGRAFTDRMQSPVDLVHDLVRLSYTVRKDSLLAMEREVVRDRFLRRGTELCVDGIDPAIIESVLRSEGASILERHERGQRILRGMGNSSPAFGMIGTLIGLVQMLSMMDDPSKIGGSMAVAMLTTFYGALLAYLVFLPLADKLGERARQEVINREIIIQGLVSILAGTHPRLVERRLLGLLDPEMLPAVRAHRSRAA